MTSFHGFYRTGFRLSLNQTHLTPSSDESVFCGSGTCIHLVERLLAHGTGYYLKNCVFVYSALEFAQFCHTARSGRAGDLLSLHKFSYTCRSCPFSSLWLNNISEAADQCAHLMFLWFLLLSECLLLAHAHCSRDEWRFMLFLPFSVSELCCTGIAVILMTAEIQVLIFKILEYWQNTCVCG